MVEDVIRWSGLALMAGAFLLGASIVRVAFGLTARQAFTPLVSALFMAGAILLLLALPGLYARQATASGWLGLAGYLLLQAGVVLFVIFAATPLLYPAQNLPFVEHPVVFLLGIALTLGLLLTGSAILQAGVLPRAAGWLLLTATAGFFFNFFVSEFLPPQAGQWGAGIFGILLAVALAWLGLSLWTARLP